MFPGKKKVCAGAGIVRFWYRPGPAQALDAARGQKTPRADHLKKILNITPSWANMPPMRFELFVALRYLFSRRKQTFISVISVMSILGVALGCTTA